MGLDPREWLNPEPLSCKHPRRGFGVGTQGWVCPLWHSPAQSCSRNGAVQTIPAKITHTELLHFPLRAGRSITALARGRSSQLSPSCTQICGISALLLHPGSQVYSCNFFLQRAASETSGCFVFTCSAAELFDSVQGLVGWKLPQNPARLHSLNLISSPKRWGGFAGWGVRS